VILVKTIYITMLNIRSYVGPKAYLNVMFTSFGQTKILTITFRIDALEFKLQI